MTQATAPKQGNQLPTAISISIEEALRQGNRDLAHALVDLRADADGAPAKSAKRKPKFGGVELAIAGAIALLIVALGGSFLMEPASSGSSSREAAADVQ